MEEAQAFSVNVRLSVLSVLCLHEEQIEDTDYVMANVLLKSLVKIDCDKTMHV